MSELDLDALERLFNACVELLDGEAVEQKRAQSSDYYRAQSQAMTAAFEALPFLIQRLREAEAEGNFREQYEIQARANLVLHDRIDQLERVREAAEDLILHLSGVYDSQGQADSTWLDIEKARTSLVRALDAVEEPVKL